MIKERICSYELSMLLQEKGFDELCDYYYEHSTDAPRQMTYDEIAESNNLCIKAPTHQMACDWLGDIYDLYIIAYPYKRGNSKGWCCYVYKTYNLLGQEKYVNETCNSCYEAIEAALKYALENLI